MGMELLVMGHHYIVKINMNIYVDNVLKLLGVLFTISVTAGYLWGLYKLKKIEEKIFELQDKVDNIEHDDESKRMLHSGAVPQNIFDARNAKRLKPMTAKLNRLKMERQFLLDKIPLIGWFKR